MKSSFNDCYKNILLEELLAEGRNEALAKWGNTLEVNEYLESFMNKSNGIRLKVSSPYNNIDYWHSKRSFSDFKEFIDNFKSSRQLKKEKKDLLTITDDGKGKLLDEFNNYEIWYVGSAEASKQLGRFYKGVSAKWCISSDNCDYYWNNDHKNDTFYFLIKKYPEFNQFDKLAFEYKANGQIQIWDLNNKKNTFTNISVINHMKDNFKRIDKISDSERYFRTPNLKIIKNNDETINVFGSIYIDSLDLFEVPWKDKFIVKELFGDLNANYNSFSSLKNFPKIIHGDLNICDNNLMNDNGDIELIEGNADFSGNKISKLSKIKVLKNLIIE